MRVDLVGNERLGSAGLENVALEKNESAKHFEYVSPFSRPRGGKDRKPISPLAHVVSRCDFSRDEAWIWHVAIMT